MPEIICTLDERERALLIPYLQRLQAIDAERQTLSAAISMAVQMKVGRADVSLDVGTWEVTVAPAPEAPSGA